MSLSPLRVGRITGSRVSAILGVNPYKTAADVMREMVREHFGAAPEFTGNPATRYGEAKEPEALAAYERQAGVMTHGNGQILLHPDHDWLAVTPDGLVGDDGMVECKAPYRGGYTSLDEVPYYRPQVQLQMAVAGRAWCDFVVLQRDGLLHVTREALDPDWLPNNLPALVNFRGHYRATIADPELAAEHLADRERADDEWAAAARAYRAASDALAAAEAEAKACRDALLELAPAGAKGCGVTVTRVERAGSVDFSRAIKALAPDADLEPYRKAGTVVMQVRLA